MGLIGRFRVARRLAVMAGATAFTVQQLRWRSRLGRDCPHAAARLAQGWSQRMLRALDVDLEVDGTPPSERVLLLANHRSYIDIPILMSQVPCSFLAKAEIGGWPLFGTAARLTHTVFVQREDPESRRASRAGALDRLQRGLTFAAFPEGTTSRGPGTLPFFPGLFRLAEQHDIPVVPAAIAYEDPDDAWVDDDGFLNHFVRCFRKPRVRVSLSFGPILRAATRPDLKTEAEAWIRMRLENERRPQPEARFAPAAQPQPRAA